MEKYKTEIQFLDIPENEYDEILNEIENMIQNIRMKFNFNYEIGIGEPDA